MRTVHNFKVVFYLSAILFLITGSAYAQMANMPKSLQDKMAEIGPALPKNLRAAYNATIEAYMPFLIAAPKNGIRVTKDISYGSDPKQKLDIYQPEGKTGIPILVFLHGGAYVSGDKMVNEEIYANVVTYFARKGILGVNATYRLAPAAMWPGAALDVGSIVAWLKQNASGFGGDPNRIFLFGHSAGATHVASYVFDKSLCPAQGPGVAGIILMSGRYRVEYDPTDPNAANMQAYFGKDASQYPLRSPITHITGSKVPVFVVIAEYDNPGLDVLGAELFAALCKRDGRCPRFTRMERHNHFSQFAHFNTADEALGREIIDFIVTGH
jgi:acetyl esterase/lipase